MSQGQSPTLHKYEHGRRFYQDGSYDFPDDAEEAGRLDMQHLSFKKIAGDQLGLAPLPKGPLISLDVGCGTGIWTVEFAKEHPSAVVHGFDIDGSNLPKSVPKNCVFSVGDAEAEWNGVPDQLDYIHCRALVAVIKDWSLFLRRAYDHLKPGGWIELQEYCFPPSRQTGASLDASTSAFMRWASLLDSGLVKTGRSLRATGEFDGPLRNAGFVDIHLEKFRFPVGPWPKGENQKAAGEMTLRNLFEYARTSGLGLFTKVHGWSADDVDTLVHEIKEEMEGWREKQYWQPIVFWYARKPREGEQRPDTVIAKINEHLLEDD